MIGVVGSFNPSEINVMNKGSVDERQKKPRDKTGAWEEVLVATIVFCGHFRRHPCPIQFLS